MKGTAGVVRRGSGRGDGSSRRQPSFAACGVRAAAQLGCRHCGWRCKIREPSQRAAGCRVPQRGPSACTAPDVRYADSEFESWTWVSPCQRGGWQRPSRGDSQSLSLSSTAGKCFLEPTLAAAISLTPSSVYRPQQKVGKGDIGCLQPHTHLGGGDLAEAVLGDAGALAHDDALQVRQRRQQQRRKATVRHIVAAADVDVLQACRAGGAGFTGWSRVLIIICVLPQNAPGVNTRQQNRHQGASERIRKHVMPHARGRPAVWQRAAAKDGSTVRKLGPQRCVVPSLKPVAHTIIGCRTAGHGIAGRGRRRRCSSEGHETQTPNPE